MVNSEEEWNKYWLQYFYAQNYLFVLIALLLHVAISIVTLLLSRKISALRKRKLIFLCTQPLSIISLLIMLILILVLLRLMSLIATITNSPEHRLWNKVWDITRKRD